MGLWMTLHNSSHSSLDGINGQYSKVDKARCHDNSHSYYRERPWQRTVQPWALGHAEKQVIQK